MRARSGRTPWWPLALLATGGLLLSGCAEFNEQATGAGQTFTPAPELTPEAGPQPELPEVDGQSGSGGPAGPRTAETPIPPPQGCTDFDKAVIETCLDTVSAIATLPVNGPNPSALAAERKSGRVLRVAQDTDPVEFTKLTVDASGDGGLTGLALSPSYAEDQLVFAYITTATDNRVVRIAQGQQPKPILTGIPKGATGNRGAIITDAHGALLVATGDAGDPAAAANDDSLAGKVLRIDTSGKPAPGNPTAGSPVFASGLRSPGGLCKNTDGSRLWVTDRGANGDAIYQIQGGGSLAVPTWTWPDRPGVAGCLDNENNVIIATSTAGNIQHLPITLDGSVGGKPATTTDGKNGRSFGRLAGMSPIDEVYAFVSTVNRDGGRPVSSDDRVVIIQRQPSPETTQDKD